jgi:spore germination protein
MRRNGKNLAILAIVVLMLGSLVTFLFTDGEPQAAQAQTTALPAKIRWGYYVPQTTSVESTKQNIGNLDILSPFYFNLRPDGSVQGSDKPEITQLAKSKGVKVLPMIQNQAVKDDFSRQIRDQATVTRVIDQIEALVMNNGYDGFHIDFENVNGNDRPFMTAFMEKLYKRLKPKGKLTTQAVSGKTRDSTDGFGGSYDYAAVSSYLDYAVIMAYDYHYRGGTPGPVAPVDWVNSVAAFAASQMTPGKVILGTPLYGYDWNLTKGGFATARSYDETQSVVAQYKGTVGYDETSKEAYADYTANGDQRRVWFASPRSLAARIDIMKKYNLAGFGMWRLGHENPAFWPVIRDMLLPTAPIKAFTSTATKVFFPQTQHSLGGAFKNYWDANGGLAQFGYPWTEEFYEVNPSDGKVYIVQYFERARFEYHPEYRGSKYEVLLGLLGRQVTEGRNGEVPFQRIKVSSVVASRHIGENTAACRSTASRSPKNFKN